MSMDQDEIGLDQDWSQFWPDQDWIGLRTILLFQCDYSENIKNVSCDPILQVCLNGSVYFTIKCNTSAGTILQLELYPPLFTYNVEFL